MVFIRDRPIYQANIWISLIYWHWPKQASAGVDKTLLYS